MSLAKNYSFKTHHLSESNILEINLDSLVLALIAAFDMDFSSQEILINIRELFNKLNFYQPENLMEKIADSIDLLNDEGYLRREDGKYSISRAGKHFGLRALQNFQEFAQNFS
jgi:hypothetical protein